MAKKKVVIISTRGFIGSTLHRSLAQDEQFEILEFHSDNCNLLDPLETAKVIRSIDGPFSVVFLSTFGRFPKDDFFVYDKNKRMVENLICALQNTQIENFIFTSTMCVYGRPSLFLPISEDTPVNPTGFYGTSKYMSERLINVGLNVPVAVLRIPGTYGANDNRKSVVTYIMNKIVNDEVVELADGGFQKREFLYVDDIVAVVKHYLINPARILLNVTTGEAVSIKETAETIARVLNRPLKATSKKAGGQFDMYYDVRKLRQTLPQLKLTSLEDGIRKTAQDLKLI